jgi:aminoglycoside phosphotransferase (APT) family kinase protein
MTNTDTDDPISSAPKFHKDRSHYAEALRGWFERTAGWTGVQITNLEIPIATGFSNETVVFSAEWSEGGEHHQERLVARIEPPDGGLFPVQTPEVSVSVGLQYRIMDTVGRLGAAPVPPLVGFESDPSVLGQPFFVMRFVPGLVPGDAPRYTESGFLVDEATPADRQTMVENGMEAMAGLHRIDWQAADLGWLDASGTGNPTNEHQLRVYRRYVIDELRGREHPVMMEALTWLERNDPADERIGLSWGDARMGNIIWQDYRAGAVVDWEACSISPTEADVGWWLMFDRMSFDEFGIERLEGFPTREEMVEHYVAVSGREVRDPHYWEVHAVMRFCAIFIRLGDRMVGAGAIPPEVNPAIANGVTASLARLLDLDNPTPPAF